MRAVLWPGRALTPAAPGDHRPPAATAPPAAATPRGGRPRVGAGSPVRVAEPPGRSRLRIPARPPRPGGAPDPAELPPRLRERAQARGACAERPRAGLVGAAPGAAAAAWRVRAPPAALGEPPGPPLSPARRAAEPPPEPPFPGARGRLRGSDPRPLAPGWDS